jgi:sugar phosphate permease
MNAPLWLVGLVATTLLQMAGSYMSQSLPVVAPLLTEGIGVGREQIGAIYALNSLGSILFMAFGTPLVLRVGPLPAMQIGMFCGACALLLLSAGVFPLVVLSSLLLGLSYGPAPPASTRILAATAIEKHRGLIFSIKQAGAQAGGVLAGLTIAPVAAQFGWGAGIAMPIIVGIVVALALAVSPLRRRLEIARDPPRPISMATLFHWRTLRVPFATVLGQEQLLRLTILTTSMAVVQGCLFSFCVTYLVTTRGMSLTVAGMAYACMQGGGMIGRIIVGWAADRSRNAMRTMIVQAWASAALVMVWALMPEQLGIAVIAPLAVAMGLVCASWPGLMLSEISRLAPKDRIADAASGSTMITFCGYVVGPTLFTLGVRSFDSWIVPYALVTAQMAVMAGISTASVLRRR